MSYARMDHAGWIENHNASTNKRNAKARGKRKLCEPLPEKLSDFQARVMDIVGMVGGGIYNAPISFDCITWRYGWNGVSLTWRGGMATFDRGDLTMLVLLCHEAKIRLELDPAGPHRLRLSFWQRVEGDDLCRRHPSIDEAVAQFRAYLPEDHRVRYSNFRCLLPEGDPGNQKPSLNSGNSAGAATDLGPLIEC